MLQKLLIKLVQVKAGNISHDLPNEIRLYIKTNYMFFVLSKRNY